MPLNKPPMWNEMSKKERSAWNKAAFRDASSKGALKSLTMTQLSKMGTAALNAVVKSHAYSAFTRDMADSVLSGS